MLQNSTIQFLKTLAKNNNKNWFDTNRSKYEIAKADFTELVKTTLSAFSKKDKSLDTLTFKDCMFRINRDVRFSKNKAPYKTNMAMYFVKGGKKSNLAGYYFHCESEGKSFIGGGLYGGEADQIKKIRQEIDYNWEEFQTILSNKTFKKYFGDLSRDMANSLQREPKGYEKDNPAIDYLKMKSWVASMPITDADLTNPNLSKQIIEAFTAMQALNHFFNRALEE
jgi:uncharacterized protein (TIGR02453 family)